LLGILEEFLEVQTTQPASLSHRGFPERLVLDQELKINIVTVDTELTSQLHISI